MFTHIRLQLSTTMLSFSVIKCHVFFRRLSQRIVSISTYVVVGKVEVEDVEEVIIAIRKTGKSNLVWLSQFPISAHLIP